VSFLNRAIKNEVNVGLQGHQEFLLKKRMCILLGAHLKNKKF